MVAFAKFLKSFTNDSRMVNKNVDSVVTVSETITFRIVEPLDHPFHLFRLLPGALIAPIDLMSPNGDWLAPR
jgi:hypothetical protein